MARNARNGAIALEKIERLKPDLVTLDIEMPVMGGLEALAEIRKRHRSLTVLMFSSLTDSGAVATLDALAMGASDYVAKPTAVARSRSTCISLYNSAMRLVTLTR